MRLTCKQKWNQNAEALTGLSIIGRFDNILRTLENHVSTTGGITHWAGRVRPATFSSLWFFAKKNSQQGSNDDGKRQCMEKPSQPGVVASLHGSTDVGGNGNSSVGNDEPRENIGTTRVVRETESAAASSVVVSTVEATVTDGASSDGHEVDHDDADRTTIYQHGVC